MILQETYTLANGVKIPKIGLGTWQIPDGEDTYNSVMFALKNGYRHIDTAKAYGNEASVDRAIVVSTNDASSLRDAQRTVAELDHIKQIHLIMNRIQTRLLRRLRTTIDDAMNAAGLPLIGVVPEDPQVILCANLGQPLTTQGRKGAALACWNIAQRLEGQRVPIMRIR